jgi:hypothetical protein
MNKQYIKENRPILQLNAFPIELYEDIFVDHIQQNPSMFASKEKLIYIPRIKLKFHSCFARHIKLVDKLSFSVDHIS